MYRVNAETKEIEEKFPSIRAAARTLDDRENVNGTADKISEAAKNFDVGFSIWDISGNTSTHQKSMRKRKEKKKRKRKRKEKK